jgi:hypothetical protein
MVVQQKAKNKMSRPHTIKLRGGWKVHLDGSIQPWSFPALTSNLQGKGPTVKFSRKFQSPPKRSTQQQTTLNWAKIDGVESLDIDQVTINLQTHLANSILISDDQETHLISFSLDTNQLAPDQEFGEFWLEITDPSDE